MKLKYLIAILCFNLSFFLQAQQDRFAELKQQLDLITSESPGLEEPVDLSVSGISVTEFLRALGRNNQVNISVAPDVSGQVVNNFSNVTVAEVLIFMAKQYQLDFDITGNIIHIRSFQEPVPPPEIVIPRQVLVTYDTATQRVSMELKNDSLVKVAKALTRQTGKNIVYEPGLESKKVSLYLEDVSFDQAMDKLAFANNLTVSKTEDNFYLIEAIQKAAKGEEGSQRFRDLNQTEEKALFYIDSNLISLEVDNQPLDEVIRNLYQNLGIDYFLYSQLNGNITLKVIGVRLNELLNKIFYGTSYTYRYRDGVYIIGERKLEGLRETKRIYLQHRSVEKISEFIPGDLKEGVELKEFNELNSLLVSGSYPQIVELERFVNSIDKPVPVVIIEVLIVDYQRNNNISTGIELGKGEVPASSSTIYPSFNYTFNAAAINNLLNSFNGFGALNLGPVTPDFYLNLRLLEDNGILNVKSTPKLSTLNGHEANISIGNTEYYVVEQTNITGVQNPIPINIRNFQSVQANFTLTIKPIVSGDNQVTMEIDVEQSDFTSRITPEAPPGSVTRKFTSMIRVKGDEMILLGGLEEKNINDTGSGVPLLSRIPIIKWFFSSRNRTYSKSKLNIFIKPTVIQ